MKQSGKSSWKRLDLSYQYINIVIKTSFLAGTREIVIYMTDLTLTFKVFILNLEEK